MVSPSRIPAGPAGGLRVRVGSVFTLVTGRYKAAWHRLALTVAQTDASDY